MSKQKITKVVVMIVVVLQGRLDVVILELEDEGEKCKRLFMALVNPSKAWS